MAGGSSTPSYKHFNVTFPQQYVAHVEISRANKLNSFVEAMWREIRDIFQTLSYSPAVRAIVLTGAGPKAFTTGLDVQAAFQSGVLAQVSSSSSAGHSAQLDGARAATQIRRSIADFQDCLSAVERCEKPVICVMHGYTLGLGIDLSTCADVRICARDTRFSVKEVDIGIAADVGTLSRLPKVVGNFGWVKEVCLSARMFGAEEALRIGFVNSVLGSKEEAVTEGLKMAGAIAEKSPVAVQGTKELLNWSRDHTVADGLRYTGIWNSAALQSNDVSAAMLSGVQKKMPRFEKL
ncbi:MAG: putative enoyl CoA hydratase [Pleopsidium flavum]|nr:MAG: putative enoyl CoA hydratase [Pleopsidium flavum]